MKQIARLSLLICTLLSLCWVPSTAKICKDIHVGTDTKSSTLNDIIADGETSKLWKEDTDSPVIVTHSKKLEYFYMINLDVDLSSSNVKISYDNEQYANSTVNVKEEAGKKHWYTLEVLYNCEAYGGALLSYKLAIDIPDCGTAEFHWKKVCGYPLTPRDGFTVDMTYGDKKASTIVKNGLPIPGEIYDPEIKDFSIEIPTDVDYAKFELYMNTDDIKAKQATASDDSNVDSALASIPETTISAPKVDSDDAVATVTIDGPLVGKGGVVNKDKSVINMNFTCEGVKDFSTVEFVIPMTNFRDINLFFYKKCDGVAKGTTPIATAASEEGRSWLFWIFVALLSYLAYQTFVNFSQGAKGFDAIPYSAEIKGVTSWAIHSLSNSNKKNDSKRDAKPARSQYDDEEKNDFNIKNIAEYKTDGDFDENKYGTI